MEKKWNSPYINRFLSADTIVPGYSNPQNFNRYSYVNNNPLRYTDPTGHKPCGDGEAHDCNGYQQDPNQNPHPPKPPSPQPPSLQPDKDEDKNDNGGVDYCSTHPGACGLPPTTPPLISEGTGTTNCPSSLPNCEPLTPTQQIGWGITLALIDVAILAPIDFAFAGLSVDGAIACLSGVVLACLADIPLAALDYAAAEVTVSVNVYMGTSIANGYRSDFEWILTSNLFP